MLYTAFGKRMTPDVEYVKLEDNSYLAKIHLSVMPKPLKIPMRLDGEYEHKNPTSEYVKSVPEVVEGGSEIILHTKGAEKSLNKSTEYFRRFRRASRTAIENC